MVLAMAELGEVNGIIYEAGSRSTDDPGSRKEKRGKISIRAKVEAEQMTKQKVREPRRSAFALCRN